MLAFAILKALTLARYELSQSLQLFEPNLSRSARLHNRAQPSAMELLAPTNLLVRTVACVRTSKSLPSLSKLLVPLTVFVSRCLS